MSILTYVGRQNYGLGNRFCKKNTFDKPTFGIKNNSEQPIWGKTVLNNRLLGNTISSGKPIVGKQSGNLDSGNHRFWEIDIGKHDIGETHESGQTYTLEHRI